MESTSCSRAAMHMVTEETSPMTMLLPRLMPTAQPMVTRNSSDSSTEGHMARRIKKSRLNAKTSVWRGMSLEFASSSAMSVVACGYVLATRPEIADSRLCCSTLR